MCAERERIRGVCLAAVWLALRRLFVVKSAVSDYLRVTRQLRSFGRRGLVNSVCIRLLRVARLIPGPSLRPAVAVQ